jgi:hypothetical protein
MATFIQRRSFRRQPRRDITGIAVAEVIQDFIGCGIAVSSDIVYPLIRVK